MAEDVQLDSCDRHPTNTSSLELSFHSASRFAFNHCMLAVIDVSLSSLNQEFVREHMHTIAQQPTAFWHLRLIVWHSSSLGGLFSKAKMGRASVRHRATVAAADQ